MKYQGKITDPKDLVTKEYVDNHSADSLPDQTGQSGKFLTTDGTDASWATLSGDDHKWNDVTLNKASSSTADTTYVPYMTSTSATTAQLSIAQSSPASYRLVKWDNSSYLYAATPTAGDNTTKVATTAFVTAAINSAIAASY